MRLFPIRMVRTVSPAAVVFLLLVVSVTARGESAWPHWRGPTGNGVSPDGKPPTEWSESKNVKWKVAIPGTGSSTPAVWKDRVFVSTAAPVDGSREYRFVLLCLDRASGKVLWERVAAATEPHEGHHETHSHCAASPCTDGERVYAHFGSRGLYCYDLDGKPVWKKTDFGPMRTRLGFGEGSSPAIHGDTILVPWDHEGPSYLIALDKRTGDTRWKTERDEPSNWATPLVVEHDGRKQVVTSGQNFARGYDFTSGKELWRCSGQTSRPVASPVAGNGLVFIGSGHRGSFLGAFRLDGKGDISGSEHVAWTLGRNTPDVPSPLLSGKRLYFFAARRGRLSCVDAASQEPFYTAVEVPGVREVYSSPVAADGKVYLTSRDGVTVVIEDADEFKVIATNRLDDGIDATPAVAGDELFLRGLHHLYCIADG